MKSLSVKLGIILFSIGLGILGFSELCKAECAWVLWTKTEKTIFKPNPNYSERWEIMGAVPKYEHCLRMKQEVFEKRSGAYTEGKSKGGFPGLEVKVDPSITAIFLSGQNLLEVIKFNCLPDTIDPRK